MPEFDLKEHAAWIAEQMGWSILDVQSSRTYAITQNENGIEMKLWLSVESGRLRVSADSMGMYEFTWREDRFHAITCSLEKTPAQVVRDIERRVLPEYKALLEKLLVRKSGSRRTQAKAARLLPATSRHLRNRNARRSRTRLRSACSLLWERSIVDSVYRHE